MILLTAKFNRLKRQIRELQGSIIDLGKRNSAKDETLRSIIAQQTPSSNATVRRMARLAEEGLGQ